MSRRYMGAMLSFLALCACLVLQYTGNFSAPEQPVIGTLVWGTLLAIGLLGATCSDATSQTPAWHGAWLARLGLVAAMGVLSLYWPVAEMTYQRLPLLPDETLGRGLIIALFVTCGGALFLVGRRPWVVVAALVLGTLCVRGVGLEVWEIHPRTRDMLALIQSAQDVALSGKNPYGIYQMQHTSEVPLTYLPVLWLCSLPLRALDWDIRWMHVLADASVPLALWWSTRGARGPHEGLRLESGVALGFGALWMVLPTIQWNTIYAEPSIWWGLLAWLLATRARGKNWTSAVLLGLALCTRHFAVILLPFFLLDWTMRFGWRKTLALTSVSGAICAVLLTPFVFADPEVFWFGTLKWLREYGPVHKTWFYDKFGFARALYESGWMKFGPVFQVAGVCLGLILSAWCARREEWLRRGIAMWPMLLAYTIFVMCNGLIWFSFFIGLVLCAVLLRVEPIHEDGEISRARSRVCAIILAVSVSCGVYIVYTLAMQSLHPGLDATRHMLKSQDVRASELVDDHARRLEFVKPEPLLGAPSMSLWSHLQRIRLGERKTLWRVRDMTREIDPQIDLWTGQGMRFEPSASMATLEPSKQTRHGIYQTTQFTLPAYRGRLSNEMDAFQAAYTNPASAPIALTRQQGDAGPWLATPELPEWSRVERKRCKISDATTPMLFAHPRDNQALELVWRDVEAGEMIVFFGGIEQGAIRYGKADVTLDVAVSHATRGTRDARVNLLNRPGLRGMAVDTRDLRGERVTVTMKLTTSNAGQRWTCIDALLF